MITTPKFLLLAFTLLTSHASLSFAQQSFPIAEGWARTKVNAVIFRRNAICSFGDQQVAAFDNSESRVVLARRTHDSGEWQVRLTPFMGRPADAHNSISIAFDGAGRLHLSWDHHGNPLRKTFRRR